LVEPERGGLQLEQVQARAIQNVALWESGRNARSAFEGSPSLTLPRKRERGFTEDPQSTRDRSLYDASAAPAVEAGMAYNDSVKRPRHYLNLALPGQTVFITFTVLDFVPVFRGKFADRMVDLILQIHRFHSARLYGYVVMPEHIHLVTGLPTDQSVSDFVRRLKSLAARELLPTLTPRLRHMFGVQTGLNRRSFWQRSFRSIGIESMAMLMQKIEYIHNNPVRRELAPTPWTYPWSSAPIYELGLGTEEGLPVDVDWRECAESCGRKEQPL